MSKGGTRVSFLFSGLFWGLFLMLLGVSVILKAVFHVDIPVFRIFIALFLIFLGIKLLAGGWGKQRLAWPAGDGAPSRPVDGGRYEVVFGKRIVDLGDMEWKGENARIRLDTVFGDAVLKLNPAIPTKVKASTAFANAEFPDQSTAAFGSYVYRNRAFEKDKPCVTVKASVVFGSLEVTEPPAASPPAP